MSNEIAAANPPEDEQESRSGPDDQQAGGSAKSRRQTTIPSVEECLCAIAQLPGLVATRLLTNAQANSIRASFETILRHHERSHREQSPQLSNDDALKFFREKPDWLPLFEPLLTREQLEMIMQKVKDDNERQN